MNGPAARRGSGARREPPVWRRIDLGACPPLRAQAFAESVAHAVGAGEAPNTLLFARPDAPYISLGFHQSFAEEIDPDFAARRPVPVIRRVEGGGTTWLDPDQGFYQLVYRPDPDAAAGPEELGRLLRPVAAAARARGVPLTLRPPSDLVIHGRKISGNAGGDWDGARIVVGGILGRADRDRMADLLRLPHPGLRPIVRAELARWITSWAEETGHEFDWAALADAVAAAYAQAGLFRTRRAEPLPSEEAHFRRETVPRHTETAWRELAPIPRAGSGPMRRLRIAGPHGILVFPGPTPGSLRVATVDGAEVRDALALGPSPTARPRRLPPGSPAFSALAAAVRGGPGFD